MNSFSFLKIALVSSFSLMALAKEIEVHKNVVPEAPAVKLQEPVPSAPPVPKAAPAKAAPSTSAPPVPKAAPAKAVPSTTLEPKASVSVASSKLSVATTLPVLKSVAKEIGGNFVEANSLSTAAEDPHFVKAKPSLKALVMKADLFFQIGRSLELWVPLVVNSSGNAKLISGERLITVSNGVSLLEVPSSLSRSAGDVHPQGNPHIWLSPSAMLKVAENMKDAFSKADEKNKASYEKNYQAFKQRISEAMFGKELVAAAGNPDFLWRLHAGNKLAAYLKEKKKSLGGWLKLAHEIDYPFISYHTEFSYLAKEFSLKIIGQVEEKPGIAPSLRYQNDLIEKAKANMVKHVVAGAYYAGNTKLIEFISNGIGGTKTIIQVDCGPDESFEQMITRILQTLVKAKGAVKILPIRPKAATGA